MTKNRHFTHPYPIREDAVDSMIIVPVIEQGYIEEYDFEEIPCKFIDVNIYQICASPLLVRDLNIDDLIMADDMGVFIKLMKDKGNFGFRVGMQTHNRNNDELAKYEVVVEELKKLKCDIEYYSHNLVGIVARNRWKARKVQNRLLALMDQGLILGVETNRK